MTSTPISPKTPKSTFESGSNSPTPPIGGWDLWDQGASSKTKNHETCGTKPPMNENQYNNQAGRKP